MHIIGGSHRNRPIISPKGLATRPTSGMLRESLFNICQHYITGTRFLDLFAGSGAIGLEALSRGAASACFIDNSREAIRCIQANLAALQLLERARVMYGDLFQQLDKLIEEKTALFDIIYADPPYHALLHRKGPPISYSQALVHKIDTSPLLAPSGILFIEEGKETQLPKDALQTLQLKSCRKLGDSLLYQYEKSS